MDEIDGFEALEDEARALEKTLGSVTTLTDAFEGRLRATQSALTETRPCRKPFTTTR
jgi:hypothetical protein